MVGIVIFFCLIIGYFFVFIIVKLFVKVCLILFFLVVLLFWMNLFICIYGIKIFLGVKGLLNEVLLWLGIINELLCLLNLEFVIIIGLVYILLLFMILLFYFLIEKIDNCLLEVVKDLGVNVF